MGRLLSLTCTSLINQVIFAGGLEGPNEQLALILSPTSYRCFATSISGSFSGNSMKSKQVSNQLYSALSFSYSLAHSIPSTLSFSPSPSSSSSLLIPISKEKESERLVPPG